MNNYTNHPMNWQSCSEKIYRLRNAQNKWIMRQISTIDFSNTSASWVDKTTLDIDCELVREIWYHEDKYVYLPVALRAKKHIFDFDAKLPNNSSISLMGSDFSNYYLEYEFYRMCKDELGLTKKNIPSYLCKWIREIITADPVNDKAQPAKKSSLKNSTTFNKNINIDMEIVLLRCILATMIQILDIRNTVEKNYRISNFIKLLPENNSIIILKIQKNIDFSIIKLTDLNTGPDGLRKGWHFNIFNPIAKFPLGGKIADVTKIIMPNDIRLSRALIAYEKNNGTGKLSELDIKGDGAWGVKKFKNENFGDFLGLFAISPKRSQMITIGLMLTTIALLVCFGCIWKGIKIDIFNSDKPSIIWTMAIPVMVFILTRLAVKDQSSSYFHNMITRKYRTYLITSFILLILVCCWDDRSWNNWSGFQRLNSFYPIKWFVEHNVHPGWLTIGLTFVITVIWLGFLVSYFRARPKNFRNLSYST